MLSSLVQGVMTVTHSILQFLLALTWANTAKTCLPLARIGYAWPGTNRLLKKPSLHSLNLPHSIRCAQTEA